jgi:hypothetical protein
MTGVPAGETAGCKKASKIKKLGNFAIFAPVPAPDR